MRKLLIGLSLVGSLLGGVAAADEGYRSPVEVRRPLVEERVEVRRPVFERIEERGAYPVVERVALRHGYVWIPGSYHRVDRRWAFVPGHYQRLYHGRV